ncbi:ECF RNA polymerase sigma factor SigL [Planctomycetes bacterium Poly30]|uniref:ECF RNA polymerase sigma factor SigL n=1 Tax=Saltatorellus ferox TaxID=2528018 RepID=A0A518EUU6_9BACT|nr:ECF RNA polymerase sigma factor SigL [Planctomycetes bacterium Poly30]
MRERIPGTLSSSGPGIGPEDYESHAAWLRRLARSLVRDPSTADDLVQETWLSALRSGPSPDESLRPWLARVLQNAVRKRHRTEGRRQHREALSVDAEQPVLSAAELSEHADLIHALMGEVKDLDEPYRSTVLQSYLQGLTSVEIAKRSGVAEGTVRWRLSAARDELRERMDRRTGGRENWAALVLPLGASAKHAASKAVAARTGSSGWEFGWWLPMAAFASLALIGRSVFESYAPEASSAVTLAHLAPALSGADELALADVLAGANRSVDVPVAPISKSAEPTASSAGWALDPGQASVRVRVVDANEKPVEGAMVSWTGSRDVFRRTSEEGVAMLLFRPPAQSSSLEFRIEHRGHVALEATGRPVAGDFTDLGTMTLESASSLSGVVRNEEGQPVVGARVFTAPLENEGTKHGQALRSRTAPAPWSVLVVEEASTRSAGEFHLGGAPARPMRIWAVADGTFYSSSSAVLPETAGPVELTLVALPDHERISGIVIGLDGKPASDVLVKLAASGENASRLQEVETDADGRFAFQPRNVGPQVLVAEDLANRWSDTLPRTVIPGEESVVLAFRAPLD